MFQPNDTPSLFRTSLRQWQADWKARRQGGDGLSTPAAPRRLIRAPKAKRHGHRLGLAAGGSPQ